MADDRHVSGDLSWFRHDFGPRSGEISRISREYVANLWIFKSL